MVLFSFSELTLVLDMTYSKGKMFHLYCLDNLNWSSYNQASIMKWLTINFILKTIWNVVRNGYHYNIDTGSIFVCFLQKSVKVKFPTSLEPRRNYIDMKKAPKASD